MPNFDYTETTAAPRSAGYRYGSGGGTSDVVFPNGKGWRRRRYRQGQKYPWLTYLAYKSAGLIPSQASLTHYEEVLINPTGPLYRALAGTWYGLDGLKTSARRFTTGAYGLYPDGVPPSLVLDSRLTGLKADATQKAKLECIDLQVNVAQFIAEYGQTRMLIADTAISIAKSFRHLRHGRPDLAFAELTHRCRERKLPLPNRPKSRFLRPFDNPGRTINKRVSDSWLQLQYGWLPLVSDVTSAAELLAQIMDGGRDIRQTIKKSARDSTEIVSEGTLMWDSTPNAYLYKYRETLSQQAVARTGYVVDITNADLATLASTGLDNPMLVAWELVPYSFVVDWFYKVGDFLSALSAFRGVTIRDKWQSLLVTQNSVVNYYGLPSNEAKSTESTTRWSRRWYQRLNTVTDPVFHIRKGTGLNATRVGNAIALMAGTFGRQLPRRTPFYTPWG